MSETASQEISAGAVAPGECKTIQAGAEQVAVFNVEGRYYAISNKCPHRGGPLSRGRLERPALPTGECTVAVRCPIHGWLFDLETGAGLNQPQSKVRPYSVRVEGDQVFVLLPPTGTCA